MIKIWYFRFHNIFRQLRILNFELGIASEAHGESVPDSFGDSFNVVRVFVSACENWKSAFFGFNDLLRWMAFRFEFRVSVDGVEDETAAFEIGGVVG